MQEDARALGFVIVFEGGDPDDEPPPERYYLWPENEWVWRFFLACRTQWREGFEGATGLDYAGVEVLMLRLRVPRRRQDRLHEFIRGMELAALVGWREQRDELRERSRRRSG